MRPRHRPLLIFLLALAWGCADGGAGPVDPGNGISGCALDDDCPLGLLCRAAVCVSPEDLLPPDFEHSENVARPVGSSERLFLLSTDSSSVLVLDPLDLSITPVRVAADPVAMALIPGGDALAVLSRSGQAISVVAFENDTPSRQVARLTRRHHALSVSPDGRYAIAYTPNGITPDDGAEGRLSIVDLERLQTGDEVEPVEIAAGYRHTNIFYRMERGVATLAVVVGKDEVALVELATARVTRTVLPKTLSEVIGREVVAVVDSPYVLFRAFAHPGLAVLDVDAGTIVTLDLPAIATDLDLSPDGTIAAAALRASGQIALLTLDAIANGTTALQLLDIADVSPGQIEFNADGTTLVVFSTQDERERFGLLDLTTRDLRIIDRLRKRIREVIVADDGRSAIVVHQAQPTSSVADDYERAVDRDEGYTIVDLGSGRTQLERTGSAAITGVVVGPMSQYAAVTISDPEKNFHRVDTVTFQSLTAKSFLLGSAPEFLGAFAGNDQRAWITQVHAAGRLSIVDLAAGDVRTLTGYQLNAEIE